ncbi:tRNA lysidine(34) synthetase TilS ['Camptotheca acuminata' phytoplasma]|uniref:tRNA lysidine(34) synthetase TilS n=1 Tax='Camptotheca acuminata' phytoplasma TaxID=3239192 RepID=UPI003519DC13
MNFRLGLKLDKQKNYIISVSGGVDSMVLLDYLYNLQYSLIVVHFNHLQREQSFEEKKMVEQYCSQRKISFHYFELHINKKDFQNQARILRQEKLKEIALQCKTVYLMTAHHLDDLAETILFKIARGSSMLGYSGMQPSYFFNDFYFLKPFLYISKQEILEYASQKNVPFLEDHTNQLNKYTRNKIRHQIVPYFKGMNNFLKNIKKFHLQLIEANNFVRKQTYFFLKNQKEKDVFDLNLFLKLDILIQKDIVLFFLESKNIKKNFDLVTNITSFLKNISKPSAKYSFHYNNWSLVKKYDIFFWIQEKNINNFDIIYKPLLYYSKDDSLLFNCFLIQKISYNIDSISPPFILRKKQPGDILHFSFGSQKLKKFLINSKISLDERDKLWLVVDKNNVIIWIPGLYLNKTLGYKNNLFLGLQNNNYLISQLQEY